MAKALGYVAKVALMPVGLVLLGLIKIYQYLISPMFPPTCRFLPTCSEYASDALRVHGPVRGGWLALWRMARCNPWGGHGYDPVPGITCNNHDHSADILAPAAVNGHRPTKRTSAQRSIEGTS